MSANNNSRTPTKPKVGDGPEFRDLLKGRIDIIQYLTASAQGGDRSGAASVDSSNGNSLVEALLDDKSQIQTDLMLPSSSAFSTTAPSTSNNNSIIDTVSQADVAVPPNRTLSIQANLSTRRPPAMYVNGQVRLPESPPETDSGGGSAGSPSSGSENSPYSPEFTNSYGQLMQGHTVIHPPVANGQHMTGPHHATGAGGVILGVHNMDLAHLVQQELLPGVHQHPSSQYSPYPQPQPTPGALAPPQVSPPNIGGNTCPPSPYILPNGSGQHGGGPLDTGLYMGDSPGSLSGRNKRMRAENGQYVKKTDPTSPRNSVDESVYDMDGYSQQAIRFSEFQKEKFHALCDQNGRDLQPLGFHVVADKGFNYSQFDGTFVNQKKNHFQISVHIEAHDPCPPKYVRVDKQLKQITEFRLDFYGVKAEMPSSTVQIKQSQTDRKPVPYEPVKLDLPASRVTKVTVARLHFSETTMNNQRKNGRPNPDQKFLYLSASLNAVVQDGEQFPIVIHASEKVIVRASNPGQFDSGESDAHWQKGAGNSIYHTGPVAIGTDQPARPQGLTVSGDIAFTGQMIHPSDARLKQNVEEVNCAEALARLSQVRIVHYEIRPEVAEQWGLREEDRYRMGVIAQELGEVIPDAVREDGDYLQVDDNRLFYESAAAVKELCRLTGNLEGKIEEVEKISSGLRRWCKMKRMGSIRSTGSIASSGISSNCQGSYISCSRTSLGSSASHPVRSSKTKDDDGRPQVKYTEGRREGGRSHSHHRHCDHYCRRPADRSLCSSKIIQGTIVALVVVMAFCLIAMATLYILDWHKRNTATPPAYPSVSQPSVTPDPSASTPAGGGQADPANIIRPGTDPEGTGNSGPGLRPWPGWTGTPPTPLRQCKLNCKQYCCPSKYRYVSGSEDVNDQPEIALLSTPEPVGTEFEEETQKNPAVDVRRNKRETKSASGLVTDYINDSNAPTKVRLGSAKIKIVGLNVTIDQRYCPRETCNDQKRGNYTFFIPVSAFMPHIPLDIEFEVDDKMTTHFCDIRSYGYCDGASVGKKQTEHSTERNRYHLPVGYFHRVDFKFRVGYSTTSCATPSSLSGQNYDEYNLIFYRVCPGDP